MIIFDDEKFYRKFITCSIPSNYRLDVINEMRRSFNRLYSNSIITDADRDKIDYIMSLYGKMEKKKLEYLFARQEIKEDFRKALVKMDDKVIKFSIEEMFSIWKLPEEKGRAISLAIMFLCKYFNRTTIFKNIADLKLLVGFQHKRFDLKRCRLAKGCYFMNQKGYKKFYGYKENKCYRWYDEQTIKELYKKVFPIEYKYTGECYLTSEMREEHHFIEDLHLIMEQMRDNLKMFN